MAHLCLKPGNSKCKQKHDPGFVYITKDCELCISPIIRQLAIKFWLTTRNALLKIRKVTSIEIISFFSQFIYQFMSMYQQKRLCLAPIHAWRQYFFKYKYKKYEILTERTEPELLAVANKYGERLQNNTTN